MSEKETYAYTPGLKVKKAMTLRKNRMLPLPGQVLVKEGDEVDFETIVARMEIPGAPEIVKAHLILRVMPDEVKKYMIKKVSENVRKGEVIAKYIAFFGLIKRFVESPIDGKIENVGASGWITLRTPPALVEINAYIPGKVVEVVPAKGVVVETNASFIQGIFGIGGERHGQIRVLVDSPDEVLTEEKITPDNEGKIIVGGSLITLEALKKAVNERVAGIVVGGFDGADLTTFLGYEVGIAITGEENINTVLIITEGFGEIPMSSTIFDLFKQFEGRMVCINGSTQIRAGVIRPEVIIPHDKIEEGEPSEELYSGMRAGTPIRVIRQPYFGSIGTVVSLPVELKKIETGSTVRVVEVELEGSKKVIIPRANVEIIEI